MTLTNPCNRYKRFKVGMTLIELLMVMAIIGILAGIGYPKLTQHLVKAHRKAAQADLIQLQLVLEQTYNRNDELFIQGYDFSLISNGHCGFCQSDPSRYWLSIDDRQTYTLSATPLAQKNQTADDCGTLQLNAQGEALPARCW